LLQVQPCEVVHAVQSAGVFVAEHTPPHLQDFGVE
jgi:hypothetical protein